MLVSFWLVTSDVRVRDANPKRVWVGLRRGGEPAQGHGEIERNSTPDMSCGCKRVAKIASGWTGCLDEPQV